MQLWPDVSLTGLLLLLLVQGPSQIHSSSGEEALAWRPQQVVQALKNFPFPCKPKKLGVRIPSNSVHSLRPSDIKLVAAIGNLGTPPDSDMITMEKPQSIKDEPQHGCMGVMSVLSDIIRHFNPSVLMPTCSPGRSGPAHSTTEDLWIQAKELVKHLKENPQLDFENDWKLITVFFSNTSQCHLCPSAQEKRHLMRNMEKLCGILDYLHQEVPRAFVNLVDLSEVLAMAHQHQETGFSPAPELCNCSTETTRLSKAVMQWSYQEAWEGLLASSKFNKHESFAVVFQPFFYEVDLPSERFSPQDPSILALRIWNNMIKPVGLKDELLDATERMTMNCPSQESPYLFTYRNSNYQAKRLKPGKLQVREGTEFSCPDKDPSDTIPTTVHRLRPADIKVIGALGDSLTAANGAGSKPGNVLDVLTQYRGLSWSVGGDENIKTVTTLANILREFNPSLKGFSVGTGRENTAKASFNQAVAGAKSEDLVTQARKLVSLMKADKTIDFQEDWKIITVFIGGNDLCDSCNDQAHFSPQNFTNNIKNALDILHAEVPRAFVNMVEVIQIINLRELYKETQVSCPRLILRNLCPCVLKIEDNSTEFVALVERNRQYQKKTEELIQSGRYDTRDDFTVVLQPFFESVAMPRTPEGLPDSSFFAPDCFHFNVKTHARSAAALWKNMLEPVGHKTRQHNFEIKIPIMCPNQASPFLSTYKNSHQGYGSWMLCKDRAPSALPPTSVHALRPADIQIVAALGDSLTAGNGISSQESDLSDANTQYRGLSYSAGGDLSLENVTTLPNILREFNGNLTGYAVGTGDVESSSAFLNQAVPRAKAEDLASQVQTLVQRMKNDHRVNFHQDWKVITVMIGASDLCDFCTDSNRYSAGNFFDHLRNALDILHREVPRALVNLVDFMNPSVIRQVFLKNPDKCPMHQASVLCNCVLTPGENSHELARLEAFAQSYQSSILQLVESSRYDTREDFSVVLQPLFLNIKLPVLEDGHPDTSFFAPDCILPNQKFHSQLSRALWANMLEPLGKKTDTLDLGAFIAMACPTQDEPFLRTFRNSNYTYPSKPAIENWGSDFLCPEQNPSSSVPSSVHELRPADIKVVAAMGDSLTTASGAQSSESSNLSTSWRGLSWSIGGDGTLETHTTLPNILKKYNPSILGFSTGTLEETAGLNVAEDGARAQDMPAQAQALVRRMKNTPTINLQEDWKLVTLFIGINDLCHYCENPENHSANEYVKHIQQALDILYEELPRVFINVVEVMELAGLYQGQDGKCAMSLAVQNCSCFKHAQDPLMMQELRKVNWNLQSDISELSYWHRYMQREDFAIVLQPFLRQTLIPLSERGGVDLTFFSEDCLHFSERGHAEMAIALWNNMLEPVGRKTTFNNFSYNRTKLKCPSPESPFLYTVRNSQLLPDQAAEASSNVLYWAVPVAAVGGLVVGILGVMLWRAIRRPQKEVSPSGVKTTSF
ncbi:phospholipase B1, membrane-associated [Sigmodon hispidus]